MRKTRFILSIVSGILLVAVGIIFLLDNLAVISLNWGVLVGPLFAIGGLVFLTVFIMNTNEWWALIPGFILFAIGLTIFLGQTQGAVSERYGGAVFLGLLGTAFILIYITHRKNWWALIPGGVLITLAGVTLIPASSYLGGGMFFLGLALTFGMVYILPKPEGKLKWAIYPAGILLVFGIVAFLGASDLLNYIWPFAMLIAGGYILYRALRK